MGAQVSAPLPAPHPATAFLAMYKRDELLTSIDVEKTLVQMGAMQRVREREGPYTEYDLNGTPWAALLWKNRIRHLRNLTFLFRHVASTIGPPIFSTDASRGGFLSLQTFLRSPSPVPMDVAAIALNSFDHLILLTPPHPEAGAVRSAISAAWPPGIKECEALEDGVVDFKLNGYPWQADGHETVYVQTLLCALHATMLAAGWRHCIGVGYWAGNRGADLLLYFRPSAGPPPPLIEGAAVCAISLNMNDTFRCIGVPAPLVTALIEMVPSVWPRGVQRVEEYAGVPSIKLLGNPWWAVGDEDCAASRALVCAMLGVMVRAGWDVFASLDFSNKLADKSAFYFLRSPPRPSALIGAVSLHDIDMVRCVGLPPAAAAAARAALAAWPLGIQREGRREGEAPLMAGVQQYKLKGRPWALMFDSDRRHVSAFLANVIGAVVAAGGRPVTSADVSAKYHKDKDHEYKLDVDCLFFEFEGGGGSAAASPVQFGLPIAAGGIVPDGPARAHAGGALAWSVVPAWATPSGAAPPPVPPPPAGYGYEEVPSGGVPPGYGAYPPPPSKDFA